MLNDHMNEVPRGNTLCSDGDVHDAQRRVVLRPLRPLASEAVVEETSRVRRRNSSSAWLARQLRRR
jgi:hypothetical protein